jgi:hypothetical protein
MLEAILSKYLLNALLLSLVSIFYSFLKNKLGEDRAGTIKEAILSAMLWAEEELGIGNGNQKWEMKANVGKINKQTYDILSKRKLLKVKGPTQQSLLTK